MFSEGALYLPTSSELHGISLDKMILQNTHQSALLDAEGFQEDERRETQLIGRNYLSLSPMIGLCHRSDRELRWILLKKNVTAVLKDA